MLEAGEGCWVYREFGEYRKVIRWRRMGERNSQSKSCVSRGYDQMENVMVFYKGREVNVLSEVERRDRLID